LIIQPLATIPMAPIPINIQPWQLILTGLFIGIGSKTAEFIYERWIKNHLTNITDHKKHKKTLETIASNKPNKEKGEKTWQ